MSSSLRRRYVSVHNNDAFSIQGIMSTYEATGCAHCQVHTCRSSVERKLESPSVMKLRHVDDDVGLGELHDAHMDVGHQCGGRGIDLHDSGRVGICGNVGIGIDEAALGGSDDARGC